MPIDPGLRRLALGTLLGAFPGTSAPQWALNLLADGLAGHTLFGRNIGDQEQVTALTGQLRSTRTDVLLAIDEEGGDVTRLAHRTGSPYPGNAALGVVDDPELTYATYAAIGADLIAAGINLNLAPTVDVNTAEDNPIIGTRSFGADPTLVARHTSAAVAGLQSTGVAACAKHFPGHGATIADSHLDLPVVEATPDLLRVRDLPPFAAAIEADVAAIMTAHIRMPSITGDDPATFSPRALTELLRGEYGFRGAIITDALEMRGATMAAGGTTQAAVRALAAGADLLCIGARVDHTLVEAVAAEIVAATVDGRLPVARLEDAVARTAELARRAATPGTVAVRDEGTVAVRNEGTVAVRNEGTVAVRDERLGFAAARRAVRVEGSLAELAGPLVVRLVSGSNLAEAGVPWGLGPHLSAPSPVAQRSPGGSSRPAGQAPPTAAGQAPPTAAGQAPPTAAGQAPPTAAGQASPTAAGQASPTAAELGSRGPVEQVEIVASAGIAEALASRAGSRPIVVVGRHVHRSPEARELIERLAVTRPVGVVEMGWPGSWRPANIRAFVTTYGASFANGRAAAELLHLAAD